jgi:hypothetical protein
MFEHFQIPFKTVFERSFAPAPQTLLAAAQRLNYART